MNPVIGKSGQTVQVCGSQASQDGAVPGPHEAHPERVIGGQGAGVRHEDSGTRSPPPAACHPPPELGRAQHIQRRQPGQHGRRRRPAASVRGRAGIFSRGTGHKVTVAPAALRATTARPSLWISRAVIHRPCPFPPLLPSFAYTPARRGPPDADRPTRTARPRADRPARFVSAIRAVITTRIALTPAARPGRGRRPGRRGSRRGCG